MRVPKILRTVFGVDAVAALPDDIEACRAEVHRRVLAGEPIPIRLAIGSEQFDEAALEAMLGADADEDE